MVLENVVDSFQKRCPWFWKTLPMKKENVAHDFLRRCPWFFSTTGNVFLSLEGNEVGELGGDHLIG